MRDKRLSPGAGAAAWMLCALALAVPGLARADDAALVAKLAKKAIPITGT